MLKMGNLISLEMLIAYKYLRSKRKEGFISINAMFAFVGIMIGVATLIVVMSVMNGFRYELVNRILGVNSHISINSRYYGIENYQELIERVKKIPGITYVNPMIDSQAMIASDYKTAGVMVRGIKYDDMLNKKLISNNIQDGDLSSIKDKKNISIGFALANNLNVSVGDEIKLFSAKTNKTILGTIPRVKTYKVGSIFDSGLFEYDSAMIFANFEMTQIHFQYGDKASAVEIFVNDPSNMNLVKEKLYEILNEYDDLYLIDWEQSNASFMEALKVERTAMFLILTLIILVAAFNIISSMIMLVNDKKKNIALLKTLGMNKLSIMKIFLICGSFIGFLGTIIGLIVGVLFSMNINNIKLWLESITDSTLFNPAIYFLSTLPSKIFLSDVIVITLMSLLLSFLATIYPAYKASKTNPADILRYE